MPNIWTTVAVGAIGGIAASFVMERYQAAAGPAFGQNGDGGDPATVQAARRVADAARAPLSEQRKLAAGEAVHYATGLVCGIGYALAVRREPRIALGFGTAFGALLMLVLDDVAVPAAGLGSNPMRTSLATHAYSLSSHLVFGATLEGTRRSLLKLLN